MRAIETGPPDPGNASAAPGQEGGATRVGLVSSGNGDTLRRRRPKFNYRDHPLAALLIAAALARCGGTWRLPCTEQPEPTTGKARP
jgi:hypothetical protein